MKFDWNWQILDENDAPMLESGVPARLSVLFRRALLAFDAKDQKLEAFDLNLKVKTATSDTEFSPGEIALLDKAVAAFPTLVYGQLHYLLLGK
jgi:hypothetical protein